MHICTVIELLHDMNNARMVTIITGISYYNYGYKQYLIDAVHYRTLLLQVTFPPNHFSNLQVCWYLGTHLQERALFASFHVLF